VNEHSRERSRRVLARVLAASTRSEHSCQCEKGLVRHSALASENLTNKLNHLQLSLGNGTCKIEDKFSISLIGSRI